MQNQMKEVFLNNFTALPSVVDAEGYDHGPVPFVLLY